MPSFTAVHTFLEGSSADQDGSRGTPTEDGTVRRTSAVVVIC
jgi:hypothetical protein